MLCVAQISEWRERRRLKLKADPRSRYKRLLYDVMDSSEAGRDHVPVMKAPICHYALTQHLVSRIERGDIKVMNEKWTV